jgi:threonine 3-dehydrogenase
MVALVTGGAGFIGAELVRTLVERGEAVHVTAHSGRLQRLDGLTDDLQVHKLDLADTAQINQLVDEVRPRVIFHLGAVLSGPGENDPQACIAANAYGTHALLEAARRNDVEQFMFASSIGSFVGSDLPDAPITDLTVQHPDIVYGVTKVFGELLGRFYRRKYGLDFRGIRYPGVVGPGVTTWSVAQCTSWVIEHPARGRPFAVWVGPEASIEIIYYKEAAAAMLQLAAAPPDAIKTINYNIAGIHPPPTMGQLADAVRNRLPQAEITFEPDPELAAIWANNKPVDDARARAEWGWKPALDHHAMVDDFLAELDAHPARFAAT